MQDSNSTNPIYQLLVAAHGHFVADKPDEAEKLCLQALSACDAATQRWLAEYALNMLHWLWRRSEADQKAIDFLSRYVEQHPETALAHSCLAVHLWYSGRLDEALLQYNASLELNPGDPSALMARGQVLAELGQSKSAIRDLELVLKLLNRVPNAREPHWPEMQAYTLNGLGAAHGVKGDYSEAFRQFQLSIALRPENGWVYFNRASVHERNKKLTEALADYRKALLCSGPKLPEYKRNLAEERIRELESYRP